MVSLEFEGLKQCGSICIVFLCRPKRVAVLESWSHRQEIVLISQGSSDLGMDDIFHLFRGNHIRWASYNMTVKNQKLKVMAELENPLAGKLGLEVWTEVSEDNGPDR